MMKFPTIKRLFKRRDGRLLAPCVAMLLAVAFSGHAAAQESGLLKYLSQASPAKSPTTQATIQNKGSNYRVLSSAAANVRTAADSTRSAVRKAGAMRGRIGSAIQAGGLQSASPTNNVKQVAFRKNCNSCGTSSCGGSCGGGSYRAGSMGQYISGGGFACGSTCAPYRFASVDVLHMERRGQERFTLSPNFVMDDFDFETSARVTVGYVPDCVHGCEFSFTGPIDWDRSGSATSATGGLGTLLIPGNPVAATDLSAFNTNSNFQSQTHTADYWSAEANKTLIGWDVVKLLVGARYIDYDEEYLYFSQNTASQTGLLQSSTDNQLFGGQIGVDLLYPVGRFAYADFRSRAGLFLNFADADASLTNAGATVFQNSSDDEDLAGVFELGVGMRYHLGEALTIRGGTEIWYLTGLASATDQINQVVTPAAGSQTDTGEDIFFYGLTYGAEFRF